MPAKIKRGFFITFEGIEGSGKTTQLDDLERALKKDKRLVLKTLEPGGGPHGKTIRQLLVGSTRHPIPPETELFLFLADRAQHVRDVIAPALRKKQIVLSDRFADSTIAYQAYGRSLPVKLLEGMNKLATGGLQPDLTFFLDVPVKDGLKRVGARGKKNRLDKEAVAFYERVRRGYYFLARYNKKIVILDGLQSREALRKRILDEVRKLIDGGR